jgi:hypothetical protein
VRILTAWVGIDIYRQWNTSSTSIAETEMRRWGREGGVPVVQVDDGSRAADGAGRRRELGTDGSKAAGAGRRREQARGAVAGGSRAANGRCRWRDQAGGSRRAEVRRREQGAGGTQLVQRRRAQPGGGKPRAPASFGQGGTQWPSTVKSSAAVTSLDGGGRRRGRRRPIGQRQRRNLASELRRNLASELRRGGSVPA